MLIMSKGKQIFQSRKGLSQGETLWSLVSGGRISLPIPSSWLPFTYTDAYTEKLISMAKGKCVTENCTWFCMDAEGGNGWGQKKPPNLVPLHVIVCILAIYYSGLKCFCVVYRVPDNVAPDKEETQSWISGWVDAFLACVYSL